MDQIFGTLTGKGLIRFTQHGILQLRWYGVVHFKLEVIFCMRHCTVAILQRRPTFCADIPGSFNHFLTVQEKNLGLFQELFQGMWDQQRGKTWHWSETSLGSIHGKLEYSSLDRNCYCQRLLKFQKMTNGEFPTLGDYFLWKGRQQMKLQQNALVSWYKALWSTKHLLYISYDNFSLRISFSRE